MENFVHNFEFIKINEPQAGDSVVVGMSGGVDSTLVALILKEKGCNVIGATMSLWDKKLPLPPSVNGIRQSCYGPDEQIDIEECMRFCKENEIPHYVINVQEDYRKEVLENFKAEYRSGRTPNPCIICNPKIKFGSFLRGLEKAGVQFDYFCTGHYASLVKPNVPIWEIYGEKAPTETEIKAKKLEAFPIMITHAKDYTKDQAYFLYRVAAKTLEKVRFPLSSLTKKEVIDKAMEKNLYAASRKESQDFVPAQYLDIIFSDKKSVPGNIINLDGKKLGTHKGIEFYTIGQRRGLGVSSQTPLYVHSIDASTNTVVLAENADLLQDGLIADNWVWAGNYAPQKPFTAFVKIRLASKPMQALVEPYSIENEYKITFAQPQRAIAPGQSAVIYYNGITLGGGLIKRSF
ncbi:MAG: tRNA 2-thiouridine(34) synthase MnmA [Treponema sp.]|nr:tRNA 2-thiouridine(34) synthase MnmA [Treponema sp.]